MLQGHISKLYYPYSCAVGRGVIEGGQNLHYWIEAQKQSIYDQKKIPYCSENRTDLVQVK